MIPTLAVPVKVKGGLSAKFCVDERNQLGFCFAISVAEPGEEVRDFPRSRPEATSISVHGTSGEGS
jgi:hypothetical protein